MIHARHYALILPPSDDLIFDRSPAGHATEMVFKGLDADGAALLRRPYFSIGGASIVDETELQKPKSQRP